MPEPTSQQAVHRELDVDDPEPATQVAEHVADISGKDVTELASTWSKFDHIVDEIFDDPPSADADVEVAFTYEGYRVTVEQDGTATYVPVDDPEESDAASEDAGH